MMTLLQVGEIGVLTLPGEPSTAVGRKVAERLAPLGVSTSLVFGYAQDHYGYLLEQDDFLRGGYEPTVSPWGWRTGQYLVEEAQALVSTRTQAQEKPASLSPPAVVPRSVEDSEAAPTIVTEPLDLSRGLAATMVFTAGEPGLGTPSVAVERDVDGAFVQLMAAPSRPMVNGPEVIRRYRATPTVALEPTARVRRHEWTARWESLPDLPLGRYRLVATGRASVGGVVSTYRLASRAFLVTRSTAIAGMTARALPDGTIAVTVRYRPNPMRFADGDPLENFRLWDEHSRPELGMSAVGERLPLELRRGTTALPPVSASWSAPDGSFVFTPTVTGPLELHVAPEAFEDSLGNTNGAALETSIAR